MTPSISPSSPADAGGDALSPRLAVCPECDALHRRRRLKRGEKARCVRCGAVLYRHSHLSSRHVLPLVVGALMTFVIANAFPIVDLEIQGQSSSATLFGSILALWGEGREPVAVLVFATTLLFPLVDLLAMLALLLFFRGGRGRPAALWRFVGTLRPWGMIEVFMLGTLVALVKLSNLAHVLPGAALWAFAALTVLMAAILTFDPHALWDDAADGGR